MMDEIIIDLVDEDLSDMFIVSERESADDISMYIHDDLCIHSCIDNYEYLYNNGLQVSL